MSVEDYERTLAIIKPDAVAHDQKIIHLIQQAGFVILQKKHIHLSKDQACDFYAEHADRPFFDALTKFMSSGPIIVLCLTKLNAIAEWRQFIGPTDSNNARAHVPGSLRAIFGTDNQRNACHGSDSQPSAAREICFFFPENPWISPTSSQIRTYLETVLYPIITPGLVQLCKEKPGNPTEWLGNWLLNNNPNKPIVMEPDEAQR